MEERFQNFTVLLAGINRCIRKIKTEEMAEFELKSTHVTCLYYLYKSDSLTARELCDLCEEDKANVSRSLKQLEEYGYLSCTSKTAKRYQSPLHLTERGRLLGRHVTERVDSILESAGEGLCEPDRLRLYSALALIHDNLTRICKSYDTEPEA